MVLNETYISKVVRQVINEMFNEVSSIPYDEHFLDGIDSIDVRSINLFIKSMIPQGNKMSVNTPYRGLRQLVLYFSDEGATKHGGRLTKDIVKYIMKDEALSSSIFKISECDRKILDLIYGHQKLTGKPLMQQIVWNLDAILEELLKFNATFEKSNIRNYFNGTEAIEGSADGRRIGLAGIMMKAFMGVDKIKRQMKKMQDLLDKGNDAFSYNTERVKRR